MGTLGELFQVTVNGGGGDDLSDRWCWTFEDVVREVPGQPVTTWKIAHETAIPEGMYRIRFTPSARFHGLMPQLMDVPGFDGIRIHAGNTSADTSGCILVGHEPMPKGDGVLHSRDAFGPVYSRLMDCYQAAEPIVIDVRNAP